MAENYFKTILLNKSNKNKVILNLTLRRFHLFEFTDQSWLPQKFRSLVTDFLECLLNVSNPFSSKIQLFIKIQNYTGHNQFIDLCSGSGGPWVNLIDSLQKAGAKNFSVILTDRYPNKKLKREIESKNNISMCPNSVNALKVNKDLKGIRTLFNGFHHFTPEQAKEILSDAVKTNQPIIIFESLNRSWFSFLYFLLTPLNVLLLTPLVSPKSFFRFFFTYIIPIASILLGWDSVISILRCYTPKELLDMAHQVDEKDLYLWESKTYVHKGLPVTYLIGYPQKTS